MINNIIELRPTPKEEKEGTISFLKELISNLEKENLDPEHCIVITNYESKIDKVTGTTESHDIYHSNLSVKEILGLIELAKDLFIKTVRRD